MKHLKFTGLILLILSACTVKPTQPPVVTFTLSPTVQAISPTIVPSAIAQTLATQPGASTTQTPEAKCKDSVSIASWTRDDVPYDFTDYDKNKPVPPNGHFTMAWALKNSGTCTWEGPYLMAFKSGRIMSQLPSYPVVAAGQTVDPGQSAIVNIVMIAPEKTGGYQAVWQLQNNEGKSVMTFNVIVKVDRGSFNPPSSPVGLKYTYSCTGGITKINLSWIDTAKNEDGYRIYRGGVPLAELSAGTASYTDVVPGFGIYEYTVVAFNFAGEAPVNISATVTTCK
jgi:Ig-like domain from next to BRCA1 gene